MRWAIVGGGLLGSSLARQLARACSSVTLYEAAPTLGGLASSWSLGSVVWDRHYHVTLASDQHTRRLIASLGLEDEMRWVKTRTGSWIDGEVYSVSSALDYLIYPGLNLWDKTRLAWTILSAARTTDWRSLEKAPVEQWLRQTSGDRVFEKFWLPLLRAKLGDSYQDTSAAFIWATIRRLYAARSSTTKSEHFGYMAGGGYARILDHLEKSLLDDGVEVLTGTAVHKVSPGPVVSAGGGEQPFDRVVVTAAPPLALRLIEGLTHDERKLLEGIRYQGIVCPSFITSQPLGGYYLTYVHGDLPFTGVVEMSAFVDRSEFKGRTLVYLPRYCAPDADLFGAPDERIREAFLAGLGDVYPHFDETLVEAFRVSRVRNVFPVPTVGYSERVPSFDTSVEGVHMVSSAQIVNGTLNVNETLQLAEQAGSHLLKLATRSSA